MTLPPFSNSRQVLNHVLNLQRFSLPNYLRFARPWTREPDHLLLALVFGIAERQVQNATRVGELLVERHASAEPGAFPMRFTGLNDLSIRYAAQRVVDDLARIIHDLRSCGEVLRDDLAAWELVQEILRDEERHINMLRNELHHGRNANAADQPPFAGLARIAQDKPVDRRQRSARSAIEAPSPA